MTTFPPGATGTGLVPGNAEGVRSLSRKIGAYAEDATQASSRLGTVSTHGWKGPAATAFREAIGEVPARLSKGSSSMRMAAGALDSYAESLEAAQAKAAAAIKLAEEADALTASWQNAKAAHQAAQAAGTPPAPGSSAPSAVDPGAGLRAQALADVAAAKEIVKDAARAAERTLSAAGEDAPNEPSVWQKLWEGGKDFFGEALEKGNDLGEFMFKLTPLSALVDPEGFVEYWTRPGRGDLELALVSFVNPVTGWALWETGRRERARPAPHRNGRRPLDEIYEDYQVETDEGVRALPELPFAQGHPPLTASEERLLTWLAFSQGPVALARFFKARDKALEQAERAFPALPGDDSHRNAFQHAYWNALLTREFGESFARKVTTAHEAGPGNPTTSEAMDLYNNETGRIVAMEHPGAGEAELAHYVEEAMHKGDLIVVDAEGNLAYSNDVPLGQPGPHKKSDQPGKIPAESR